MAGGIQASIDATEAFPTSLQQRQYAIMTTLADTGLRVSELVKLYVVPTLPE